jgi:hypothetical protein
MEKDSKMLKVITLFLTIMTKFGENKGDLKKKINNNIRFLKRTEDKSKVDLISKVIQTMRSINYYQDEIYKCQKRLEELKLIRDEIVEKGPEIEKILDWIDKGLIPDKERLNKAFIDHLIQLSKDNFLVEHVHSISKRFGLSNEECDQIIDVVTEKGFFKKSWVIFRCSCGDFITLNQFWEGDGKSEFSDGEIEDPEFYYYCCTDDKHNDEPNWQLDIKIHKDNLMKVYFNHDKRTMKKFQSKKRKDLRFSNAQMYLQSLKFEEEREKKFRRHHTIICSKCGKTHNISSWRGEFSTDILYCNCGRKIKLSIT